MIRVKIEKFSGEIDEKDFELLEEACTYFFRNLKDTTYRITLYENVGELRLIVESWRMRPGDSFTIKVIFNIF